MKTQKLTRKIKEKIRVGLFEGGNIVELCRVYHVRVVDVRAWLRDEFEND